MLKRKIECGNGWLVFIVSDNHVIQVHSNGMITSGNDDRAENDELITQLVEDAANNQLHSQDRGGVRWE